MLPGNNGIYCRWVDNLYLPCSYQCRWCRSTSVGSTPPAFVSAGWESGESGWTPWPSASEHDNELCLSTASGWWPRRFRRCWRTLELKHKRGELKSTGPLCIFTASAHWETMLTWMNAIVQDLFQVRQQIKAELSFAQRTYLQPISITQMEKIFSELVFGETFPKPTLVRLLKVK